RPDLVITTMAAAASLPADPGGALRRLVLDDPLAEAAPARQAAHGPAAGAALVVHGPGPLAGEILAETLNKLRISHALIMPTVLAGVLAAQVPGLECPIVGGEACPGGLAAEWSPGRRMFNAYGPTEITIAATLSGQ